MFINTQKRHKIIRCLQPDGSSPYPHKLHPLTLTLLTRRIWWAPTNAGKWQMGFISAFKGLISVLILSFLLNISRLSRIFPSGLPNKIIHDFMKSTACAVCRTPDFIALICHQEQCKSWSFWLRNWCGPFLASLRIGLNTIDTILMSDAFNLC